MSDWMKKKGWNMTHLGRYEKHYANGCTGTAECISGWMLKDADGELLALGGGSITEGIILCDDKFSSLFPNEEA
jgi:hypothetical protein